MSLRARRGLLFACLGCFSILALGSALRESAVFDEPTHIVSGFLYWKTGHYFLNPINTPLIRLWATLPLLHLPLQVPIPPPLWVIQRQLSLSDILFNFNAVSPDRILFNTRLMIVILGVLLGLCVYTWTRELLNDEHAALWSLVIFAFCPPLLAFSHLATADLGSAAFAFLALYAFWRFEQHPSRFRAIAAGAAMGLSITAKLTGLLFLPLFAILHTLQKRDKTQPSREESSYVLLNYVLGMVVVIVAVYRGSELYRIGQGLADLRLAMGSETHEYFAGHYSSHPWWWFDAVCFLLKTPIPFIVLTVAGLLPGLFAREQRRTLARWVLFPGVYYFGLLSLLSSQPGIRRFLFVYPVLCMWIGGTLSALWKKGRPWRIGITLLAGWYIGATVWVFPRYLSYFNESVGGPAQGHRYLIDCNSDWGQGLKALGTYLKNEKAGTVYLSYFGGGTPSAYGIHYVWAGPMISAFIAQNQEPVLDVRKQPRTLLAISATSRTGAYFGGRTDFAWLNARRPIAVLLDSIFVYDLTQDAPAHQQLADLFDRYGNPRQARVERGAYPPRHGI
jgi:hypothetical protein